MVVTGNPTKVKKKEITPEEKKSILEVIGVKTNLPIVLVFGGSQGAKRINEAMLNLIAEKKMQNTKLYGQQDQSNMTR